MRNPYALLGLPYGASADEATAAFARRARGLRRQVDGTERLRDLTWALNEVEESARRGGPDLKTYRVPADRQALHPAGSGALRPPPEPLGRCADSAEDWSRLLSQVREDSLAALREDVARLASLPPR